jgi:hypothetical protein
MRASGRLWSCFSSLRDHDHDQRVESALPHPASWVGTKEERGTSAGVHVDVITQRSDIFHLSDSSLELQVTLGCAHACASAQFPSRLRVLFGLHRLLLGFNLYG